MKLIFTNLINTFHFVFFCCCITSATFAQDNKGHCGSDFLSNNQDAYKKQLFEQKISSTYKSGKNSRISTVSGNEQYSIPVVFHIVHQDGVENISDQDVYDGLKLLNDAFAHTQPFNSSKGVDINISFCLGRTAITRDVSPLTNMTLETDDVALKNITPWDHNKYINIWVVNSINSLNMGPGVAGYAMLPYTHGTSIDGIVIEAAFVRNDPDAVKVLVHEMGHYLGLYHTFEGGCTNTDCTMNGDRVCDTPPDASTAPVPCNGSVNTCHSDSDDVSVNNPFRAVSAGGQGDQPDMIQNYMDYGFAACQNTFTEGQRTRMRTALLSSRASLLDDPSLCQQCDQLIAASINLPHVWPAGVPITLNILTARTDLQTFWMYDGKTLPGLQITETIEEKKLIKFDAFLIDPLRPGCTLILHDTIQFECPVPKPVFTVTPKALVNPGETVHFETTGAYNYSWRVDGSEKGTGNVFDYIATGTYGRMVTLVAGNGTCNATSEPYNLIPGNCAESKENNTWYFGYGGGIDFNQSPAQAIQGKIYTQEGSAVFCDVNGKPLFYSDGESVSGEATGKLLNGDGLTGSFTTTQSALFVPQPGNDRYVYLFTVAPQAGEYTAFAGMYYSVIDRLGDSGKGEVIEKNHVLSTPVVEKVTAVKNLSGDGIWIITHLWNSNAFHAWLLTSAGLSSAPVISNTGAVYNSPIAVSGTYTIGELKVSPSGKKLAAAMNGQGMVEVFDFDTRTGIISNPVTLKSIHTTNAYGVCFSPNERFLYTTTVSKGSIVRFDLQAGGQQAVINSAVKIGPDNEDYGSIQLAPDGKLYVALSESLYLDVIYNPNAIDPLQCGFLKDGFKLLDGRNSTIGLPNPVQSVLFSVKPHIVGPEKVCRTNSDTIVRYRLYPSGNATYSWIHKGPNALTVASDSVVDMRFRDSGTDTLIVKRSALCADQYDTLYIVSGEPQYVELGPDQQICKGTAALLDAGPGFYNYAWSNGDRTQTSYIRTESMVRLRVINYSGCITSDSMQVSYYEIPDMNPVKDTSICTNESIILSAPAGMDSYAWNTGLHNVDHITVSDSGTYVVTLTKYGCTFTDSIHVWKNIPKDLLNKDTLILCSGMNDTVNAPDGFDYYIWKTPSKKSVAGKSVRMDEEGYYVLTYENKCGMATDSIYNERLTIFSADTIITCADTVSLTAHRNFASFQHTEIKLYDKYKVNGNTVAIFGSGDYLAVGFYPITGNPSCIIVERLHILVDTALVRPDKHIDLGNDTSYCEGKILPLKAGPGYDRYNWNTGSRDSSITAFGFGTYSVTAKYCGHTYGDTILISRDTSLQVHAGPDKIRCAAELYTLDAGSGFDWYQWSNGSTGQQTVTNGVGMYALAAGLDGCIARDTMQVYQGNISLKIYGDTLLCEQEDIYLKLRQHAGINVLWGRKTTPITGNSDSLLVSEADTYYIKNISCPSADWDDSLTVTEERLSDPGFVLSTNSICFGDPVTVSFDATRYTEYAWDDGSVANPRTFNAPVSAELHVKGSKCGMDYTLSVPVNSVDCNGGVLPCQHYEFYLAPNPGTDYVILGSWCKIPPAEKIKVRVITVDGKIITSQQEGTVPAMNDFLQELMPQLAASMYVVEIVADGNTQYIKWIILE